MISVAPRGSCLSCTADTTFYQIDMRPLKYADLAFVGNGKKQKSKIPTRFVPIN